MSNRKDVIISVLVTFCLATTLFALRAYGAYWPYDPWWDLNDDGRIDIADVARESGAFGTYGDSTKRVTIANHTTSESTHQMTIDSGYWWYIYNDTRGFSKASVTVSIDYNWHVYAYIGFINHGSAGDVEGAPDILSLFDVYKVSKTYDVAGSTIYIRIHNTDAPSITIKVGIYLTM